MNNITENHNCGNCNRLFTIEPEDFVFYEKMEVPPPTWCPKCRMVRRLSWRNERCFYHRRCLVPSHEEETISLYAPETPYKVYDVAYWWSDHWDPLSYGRPYNFEKSFFEQFGELLRAVPLPSLDANNPSTLVACEYTNDCWNAKNCYLCVTVGHSEDCAYDYTCIYCRNVYDSYWAVRSELCYELVDSKDCSRVCFAERAEGCHDSYFLLNCRDCANCFGCVNLRHKRYCLWNQQLSKQEYSQMVGKLLPFSREQLGEIKNRFREFSLQYPRREANLVNCTNVTGNNVRNARNCRECFDVEDNVEDCKFLLKAGLGMRDCYDLFNSGTNLEQCVDSAAVGESVTLARYSAFIITGFNISYSYQLSNCANCFGCVGLKKKNYCILNRQYTKEEFEELLPRIIRHMNERPYTDARGLAYQYGEFFPPELSPFAYNETIAQEYFPLSQGSALERGFRWRETDIKKYAITITPLKLPNIITETGDSILQEVVQCANYTEDAKNRPYLCSSAFRITTPELEFYRRMGLPLPSTCPNCRHTSRTMKRNPPRLWKRDCMCLTAGHFHGGDPCPNKLKTTYAANRPEIVYCEQCYQAEVA